MRRTGLTRTRKRSSGASSATSFLGSVGIRSHLSDLPIFWHLLRRVESRGAIETTHRVQQNCGQVFRYAVATARAESDPSRDLRGALTPWKPQHYATLTDPRAVGRLLRDIEAYEGDFCDEVRDEARPDAFRAPRRAPSSRMERDQSGQAEWRIPAAKMKGRSMHIVPLATQAVRILKELKPLTGHSTWVFPGVRTNGEPMSENTVNAALRRLGYDRTMTHGSRLSRHGLDHAARAGLGFRRDREAALTR